MTSVTETGVLLVIALAALGTALATILATRAACPVPQIALLETLEPLSRAAFTSGAIEGVSLSNERGAHPLTNWAAIDANVREAIEVRGWAGASRGEDRVAAVIAVVDGRHTFHADTGSAPEGTLAARSDGRAPFDVVVPLERLTAGAHVVTIRVVPRSLAGYIDLRSLAVRVR